MELAFNPPAEADGGVDRVLKKADRGGDKGSHFTGAEWLALVTEYVEACSCCGAPGGRTVDHVMPLVLGGSNTTENVQVHRATLRRGTRRQTAAGRAMLQRME